MVRAYQLFVKTRCLQNDSYSNRLVFAFVLLLILPPIVYCQVETATVSGVITDQSGAVMAGAEVRVTNTDTNMSAVVTSNESGVYVVTGLKPGPYRIQVKKDGFNQIDLTDFTLNVQDDISRNFALRVGSTSESVSVEGKAESVETSGAVSTVIDRDFVSKLPLNGRSFNTLLQLTPGVVIAPSGGSSPGQFSINGQRTDANYFTVDGVSANFGLTIRPTAASETGQGGGGGVAAFNAYGGTSSLVSVDALQEFRVQTSSFAPEYGRTPGGQVAIETRSGTDQFHGDVFDYFRNDALDANNWFNKAVNPPLPKAEERQNDFGGVLGGPIVHEKTFFFFSYEGLRLRQPQTSVITVPSLAIRTATTTLPATLAYLDAFPLPNGIDNGNGTAQFTGSYSNAVTQNAVSLRVDQKIKRAWTLFARYNYAPSQLKTRINSLSEVETSNLNTQTFTLGATAVLAANITNAFRGNYSIQSSKGNAIIDNFDGAVAPATSALLPSPLTAQDSSALFLNFDNTAELGLGRISDEKESQINLVDDAAMNIGAHQLKFGVNYTRLNFGLAGLAGEPEYAVFSGMNFATTAQAFIFANTTFGSGRVLFHSASLYGQDAWRLGSRLVLTYGLRWEFDPAPSGRDGISLAAWTNTDSPQATAIAPAGSPVWKNTYDNFAPRLGVAYRVTSKGDLVIRVGGGIFYDLGTGPITTLGTFFPNSALIENFSVPFPLATAPTPPPPSLTPPYGSTSIIGFSPNLKLPRSYQWNLALEKSFWGQQVVSLTYLGQAGRDLLRQSDEIQPNSNFPANGQFRLIGNGDSSDYDALQIQYRRPLSKGLQALLNYTWSHSIDTGSDDAQPLNSSLIISPDGERGPSSFDVRQNFTGALTYNLPSFARRQILGKMTKDWSVDTVVQARTGFPFDVTTTTAVPGSIVATRPDVVPGVPYWMSDPTAPGGERLNPAAFSIPQVPRQGTLGRNGIEGFGLTQVDLSLARRFSFTERAGLSFRADFFNILNHPNFTNPSDQLILNPATGMNQFAGGGVSTQMLNQGLGGLSPLYQIGGPRSIQMSLKFQF